MVNRVFQCWFRPMNENATHGSPLSDGPAPHRSLAKLDSKPTRLSFSTAVRRIAWGLVFALAAWVTWKGFTSEPAREVLRFDWYSTTFGLINSPQVDQESIVNGQKIIVIESSREIIEIGKPARAWIELVERELDSTPQSADRCLESIGLFLTLARSVFSHDENGESLYVQAAARVWKRMHQFAPDEPRLWRALARSERLGLVIADMFPDQRQSRLEQFAEAVQHDPQNSLYQYLAAPALHEVEMLVRLDELAPRLSLSPTNLARIRAARTLHDHFAKLPKETPLIDLADHRVLVLRALGWIPFDHAERRRWADRLSDFGFSPVDEWFEDLPESTDFAEVRQRWELAAPRSPTFDYGLKKIAATNEELAMSHPDGDLAKSWVRPPSSETKLNLLVGHAALEQVDELRGLDGGRLHWITSLTRNRLLIVGLGLIMLGATGSLFHKLSLRRKIATTVPCRFSGILTLCAAFFGMNSAALLIFLNAVYLDDSGYIESGGVESANEWVLRLPILGFGLLEVWLVRRILGSRLAITRPVRATIMTIALGVFIGWWLLYQSVISAAEYNFVTEVSHVLQRSNSLIVRYDGTSGLEAWDVELSRSFEWSMLSPRKYSLIGWFPFVVSQGLPIGFALSALTLVATVVTFTPGAGGRSVWNWLWGTKTRLASPDHVPDSPVGPWVTRVAVTTFRGWRILGASALILWLATTAISMRTAESQDRRAFGSEATAEVLWNDYLNAIEEIRADEALMDRLRHPPLAVRSRFF